MKISKKLVLTTVMALLALMISTAVAQPPPPPGGANGQSFFSDPDAADAHCGYTDESTSGPFYVSGTAETDNLNTQNLSGELMKVSGVVYDGSTGEPIPNAHVEVWHADSNGVYYPEANGDVANFSADQINLRGTVVADENGAYSFTSIKPGIYEGRRRHVHYYITAEGYLPLFTQTYWPDDPNIAIDGTDANTESCRYLTFTDMTDGGTEATFDIYMRPDPNYVPTAEATTAAEATAESTAASG